MLNRICDCFGCKVTFDRYKPATDMQTQTPMRNKTKEVSLERSERTAKATSSYQKASALTVRPFSRLLSFKMFLPAAAPPTSSNHLSDRQAAFPALAPKAWSGPKIAAVTLGTILGISVFATFLCFVMYKLYWFTTEMILEHVKSALAKSHTGSENSSSRGPISLPNPVPTSPDDGASSRPSSPAGQAPPPSPPKEGNRRQQNLEDLMPFIQILTPRMPDTSPDSLSKSWYPGSGRRAPPPSPQREGRQRQRSVESSRGSSPPRRSHSVHPIRYVPPFVTSEPPSRRQTEQDVRPW